MPRNRQDNQPCQLCEREVSLTFHHLIPRKLHRRSFFRKNFEKPELNQGVMLCKACHRGIHKLFDEMTLGKHLSSLEALKQNSKVKTHVEWVKKQKEAR